jgi:hypothetical protein
MESSALANKNMALITLSRRLMLMSMSLAAKKWPVLKEYRIETAPKIETKRISKAMIATVFPRR